MSSQAASRRPTGVRRGSFLDRERTVAPPGYSRWLIPPAALAVHLSIGQVYAFSVFKTPLQDHFGTEGTPIAVIFSIAIVMLGLAAAFGGTWVERNGPRKTMVASALFFCGGLFIASAGVALDQLWVVYLGYGVVGGIGLGLGYISPVSTLIKWFPDRPGLATGLAIMGFGGGALIASPLTNRLLGTYADAPENAIAPTMITLASAYLVLMLLGAWVVRVPAKDWRPAGWTPPQQQSGGMRATADTTAKNAIRTPQFWLLWVVLFTNVTAGIGILEQAAPMVREFFSQIDAAAAAGFVGVLSLCNMAGRFVWSSTSDVIGRKRIYMVYLGVGLVAYLGVVLLGTSSVAVFVILTGIILSFYGGGFATIPAYLKDMFGGLQVGAIHGRLLTAWSAAGVAGPLIINSLVDARRASGATGASLYQLPLLVMVGVLAVGFVANALVRPVDPKFQEPAASGPAPSSAGQGRREGVNR